MILSSVHIEQFPRSLHGIFDSIIPEENEEVFEQPNSSNSLQGGNLAEIMTSNENHERTNFMITNEVMKLGLTANMDNNVFRFEPFWSESCPKLRETRHCLEQGQTHEMIETDMNPNDWSSREAFPQTSETAILRRNSMGKIEHLEIKDMRKLKRSRKIHSESPIECKSEASQNTTEYSPLCDCGLRDNTSVCSSIDSVNSAGESSLNFSDVGWCSIFKCNESLRRTSSVDCLRNIRDRISIPECKEADTNRQHNGEILDLQRALATSDTRLTAKHHNSDNVNIDNDSKDDLTVKYSKLSSKENRLFVDYDNESRYSHRPRSKSMGVIKWAKCNKVRHSKRENNMFSPTSF